MDLWEEEFSDSDSDSEEFPDFGVDFCELFMLGVLDRYLTAESFGRRSASLFIFPGGARAGGYGEPRRAPFFRKFVGMKRAPYAYGRQNFTHGKVYHN